MAFSGALPLAASATTNLFAAREQMAFTLAFHIVLACLGVALPATILVAHYIGLKRDDRDAMELAQRWSKAITRKRSESAGIDGYQDSAAVVASACTRIKVGAPGGPGRSMTQVRPRPGSSSGTPGARSQGAAALAMRPRAAVTEGVMLAIG